MERFYCFNEENNGYEPCDILLDHGLKDSGFRTYVIRKEDLVPWQICSALNSAYKAGREDAMRDLRRFMGIKE
jgi:hypothetical protein